jgi:transcriptional regulator with XRE-family HTH domain
MRRQRRETVELVNELREGRLAAGLTQDELAGALGWSTSKLARIERGEHPNVAAGDLGRIAAFLGLRLSMKLFPVGAPLRDAAQLALERRFLAQIEGWSVLMEDSIPLPGDLRAFDVTLRGSVSVGVEFITRLRDVQAQVRSVVQKQRDSRVDRVILVLLGSHANRRAVREAGAALSSAFPVRTKSTMAALRTGRDPGRNASVFLLASAPRRPSGYLPNRSVGGSIGRVRVRARCSLADSGSHRSHRPRTVAILADTATRWLIGKESVIRW